MITHRRRQCTRCFCLDAGRGKVMIDGARIIIFGSNMTVRTGLPAASVDSMTEAALTGMVRRGDRFRTTSDHRQQHSSWAIQN